MTSERAYILALVCLIGLLAGQDEGLLRMLIRKQSATMILLAGMP
jgi:hypothetical protein